MESTVFNRDTLPPEPQARTCWELSRLCEAAARANESTKLRAAQACGTGCSRRTQGAVQFTAPAWPAGCASLLLPYLQLSFA